MEGIFDQVLEMALPIALTALAAAVAWGATKLDALVKSTETDWDDKALQAFKDGLKEGLFADPKPEVKKPEAE